MATIIEFYNTLSEMKTATSRSGQRHRDGWRPIQTDFINNQYKVTFVNGSDDPDNSPSSVAKRNKRKSNQQKLNLLLSKLENDSITFSEVKEFLRIKEDLN